jgi:3-polyprenyl-4-hydroxybenzoate decarboxylase
MRSSMTHERGDETKLRRTAVPRVYDVADKTVLLAKNGRGHELSGDSAHLARAVLAFLDAPRSRAEIAAHVEALAGAPLQRREVLDELLALLLGVEAIERAVAPPPAPSRHGPGPRVVLGLTGAVASMHAPSLVARLLERRHRVRVAATAEALRFVRVESLEALAHEHVVTDMWPTDTTLPVPHINLAQWADAVLVCPASATTIGRIATGDYSSVVAALVLATRAPVMIVPSMNGAMYESAAVQRNLAQLVDDGIAVVHPASGVEVADRPELRVPLLGAAPPAGVVVQLFETMLHARTQQGGLTARDAGDWDAVYRRPTQELPWHDDAGDADMLAAVQRLAPASAALLDVGTGLGSFAVRCAALGHRVVATDISTRALERARSLAPEASVVWMQDDITATKLFATFDVVVDRGCLHLLGGEDVQRYAAAMARLVAPGGHLVVKTLVESTASPRGAHAYDAERVQATLPGFTLLEAQPSALAGPSDAPDARLFVLRA